MADKKINSSKRHLTIRHCGRFQQIGVFFVKFFRLFIYQRDWIVLPMAALVGGIVGFVISSYFMMTMEGTMTGAFVLVCICVWNGSFNSIQAVCRERDVVKREHRSGLHISSYIIAHMLYQLVLCLLQTIITLAVTYLVGVKYPSEGMLTKWFLLDFGITVLLITYAADMLSRWISTIARTTTIAMTIMPFMLVCQLIFSGGMIPLPEEVKILTDLTVACPGFKAMAAQTDTNSKPYGSINSMLGTVEGMEFEVRMTVGQILDLLRETDNESIRDLRETEVSTYVTLGEILDQLITSDQFEELRAENLTGFRTVGDILIIMKEADFMNKYKDMEIGGKTTLGEIIDYLATDESLDELRAKEIVVVTTVGKAMDLVGKNKIRNQIRKRATKMNYHPDYEHSTENILMNWLHLLIFVAAFSLLAVVTLEFVDKDKR